ncbi:MAG: hypothetical protein AABX69_01805, partial [Nanoarchaeota archaeon]
VLLPSGPDTLTINANPAGQRLNALAEAYKPTLNRSKSFGSPVKPVWCNSAGLARQPSLPTTGNAEGVLKVSFHCSYYRTEAIA